MYSRRDFGKLTLAALTGPRLAAGLDFSGVRLGVQTYSFRDLPRQPGGDAVDTIIKAMIECGLAGKIEDGRAHAEALLPVVRAAYADPNPAIFKGVLHAQGRIATPDVRLPLTNGSAEGIRRCLDAVGDATQP